MPERKDDVPEGGAASEPTRGKEIERLREACPVKPECKSIFTAPPWRWQPGAASWVWAVLKEAGGRMQGEDLIQRLAQLRGWSRRKANELRNRGLFVLEAFDLVEIERLPAAGGRSTSAYGLVEIVHEDIDDGAIRAENKEAVVELFESFLAAPRTPSVEKKPIGPDETVCLELTDGERDLLEDPAIFFPDSDLDDEVAREREARNGLHFRLEQLDRFAGYIAAHANHAEDAEMQAALDAIYDKIGWLENMYEPEER